MLKSAFYDDYPARLCAFSAHLVRQKPFCDLHFMQCYHAGKYLSDGKDNTGRPGHEATNMQNLHMRLPQPIQHVLGHKLLFNSPHDNRLAPESILEFAWEHSKTMAGRLLIIDCNLRSPVLNRAYRLAPSIGLSEYVLGTHAIHEAIMPTNLHNVYLMQAGFVRVEPIQLLMSNRLPRLFRVVSKHFDYILVNSPPYHDFVDAFILIKHIRPTVLLVSCGSTTHGFEIQDIRNELSILDVTIFEVSNHTI